MKTRGFKLLIAAVVCGICLVVACNKDGDNGQAAAPALGEELTGYQFVPLAQYLPGEWLLDTTYAMVDGDFNNGWQHFHDTYTIDTDYWWDGAICPGVEERIVFDADGNYLLRRTGLDDYTTTYITSDDSINVGIVIPGSTETNTRRIYQISADSMGVYGYIPRCDHTNTVFTYLFHRVRE